jgi:protein-tyrosine-phosphatase
VNDVPEVLFVCVHNAGRSQMAAALLDHHPNGKVVVRSVGSDPADALNPAVVAAMAELGIDLSREFPKPRTDASVKAADVVITWAAAMPARSIRASAMRTGSSRTPPANPPANPSNRSVVSATRSMAGSSSSSPSSSRHLARSAGT